MKTFFVLLVILVICTACGRHKKHTSSSLKQQGSGYNINQPEVFPLPDVLNEISGIAFYNGNSDKLYAEQDEEGRLFIFKPGSDQFISFKFGKKGDYEDVQLFRNQVIILRSDGVLYTFSLNKIKNGEATDVQEFKNLLPDGEYEGMYADNTNGKLFVLCKHCNEKLTKTNTGYIFNIYDKGIIRPETNFTIDVAEISKLYDDKRINFQPSALAWNSLRKEWFILSSVNQLLVIAAADWKVKSIELLDPSIYNQPEGMAFDDGNNLFISNEKGKKTQATLFKIKPL